jgi:RNA polymerase sigma-70 factor, ECF subfamily
VIPTGANGQPAFAAYLRDHEGGYRAHSICVLTESGPELSRVVFFNDPGLFSSFGVPSRLPAGERETVPCRG